MSVIWAAVGMYITGVAIVLYVRPACMFENDGMWKEFGLSTTQNTIFPFWMFALVWAIVSYAIATLGGIFFSTLTLQSVPQDNTIHNFMRPISSVMPNMENMYSIPAAAAAAATAAAVTTTSATPMNQKLPGYYIYDPAPQPRYVYYGPDPPTMPPRSQ